MLLSLSSVHSSILSAKNICETARATQETKPTTELSGSPDKNAYFVFDFAFYENQCAIKRIAGWLICDAIANCWCRGHCRSIAQLQLLVRVCSRPTPSSCFSSSSSSPSSFLLRTSVMWSSYVFTTQCIQSHRLRSKEAIVLLNDGFTLDLVAGDNTSSIQLQRLYCHFVIKRMFPIPMLISTQFCWNESETKKEVRIQSKWIWTFSTQLTTPVHRRECVHCLISWHLVPRSIHKVNVSTIVWLMSPCCINIWTELSETFYFIFLFHFFPFFTLVVHSLSVDSRENA